MGINSNANADPNVPGAFGSKPDPKPTPQKVMQRSAQVICLKRIGGLCKMLVSIEM